MGDVQRCQATADRLLRAQGNSSGRHRLTADARLRKSRIPRGLVLATGEDVPRGHSIRSRSWVVELTAGAVDVNILNECQQAAAEGAYAQTMASFVAWIARRKPSLADRLSHCKADIRDAIQDTEQHARTPGIVADLMVGIKALAAFAVEMNLYSAQEAIQLVSRAWSALQQTRALQSTLQTHENPAQQFLALLTASLAAGRCHVTFPNGHAPSPPEPWGWRRLTGQDGAERFWPQGDRIGWVEDDSLFLLLSPAFAVAQQLAGENGESLAITQRTLLKRLHEQKYLQSVDTARETFTIRKTFLGQKHNVIHITVASIYGDCHRERLRKSDTAPTSTAQTGKPANVGMSGMSGSKEREAHRQQVSACHACGGTEYWESIYGMCYCRNCHPPATDQLVARNGVSLRNRT